MKKKLIRYSILLSILVIISGVLFWQGALVGLPLAPHPNLKVAFIGDQGFNADSKAVLNLIKSEGAEAVFHQGDFEYGDSPEDWDNQMTAILGEDFPYFATIGNHDIKEWSGYQAKIKARMDRIPGISCSGDIGAKSDCIWKGLSYISVAPGMFNDDYPEYLKKALRIAPETWQICAWHKNQRDMQLGAKENEVGWGVYNTCKDAGAIIATAHEHSYSRSYVLDSFEPPHVVDISDTLEIAPGKTFVFVSGLGGESIRPQALHASWWGGIYSETQKANAGALFCTFNVGGNSHRASCYFKDIKGNVPDKFDVVRK